MGILAGPELRLIYLLGLSAAVFAASWGFVRRRVGGDWISVALDAFLLTYLVQYLAVCVPGALGVLNGWTMALVAVAAAAGFLCWVPWASTLARARSGEKHEQEYLPMAPKTWPGNAWAVGALAFVVGFLAHLLWFYLGVPVIANDALTYHVPAAAKWLLTGRITLLETWFFNPANTYSPLAGSAFIAWIIALTGSDLLVNFVQMGAVVMLWLALVELCRSIGVPLRIAALVAVGIVLSRPFLRASFLAKDDLFVAAFFATALAATSREKLASRAGPWRLGLAVGLLLAMKYTALLALPLLLLAADAPVRAGWRWKQWGMAMLMVVLLAGPWYVRNALLTGNPIYPVELKLGSATLLPGLFEAGRSVAFGSWASTWHALTGVDDSLPGWLMAILVGGWCFLLWNWRAGRRQRTEGASDRPLIRALSFGPAIGVALFIWKSPFAEVRFLYPVLVMLGAAMAVAANWVAGRIGTVWSGVALAGLFALAGMGSSAWVHVQPFLPGAVVVCIVVLGVYGVAVYFSAAKMRILAGVGVTGALVLLATIYIYWSAQVDTAREGEGRVPSTYNFAWQDKYPELAGAWKSVREELPPGTIAYTNTFFVYPLMGFHLERAVVYAPTRRGVQHLHDLPPTHQTIAGEQMEEQAARWATADSDFETWLGNLRRRGAKYVFIERRAKWPDPPELGYAIEHPELFVKVYDAPSVCVFEIQGGSH